MKLKSVIFVLLMGLSSSAVAQMPIPTDKDVRVGKLSNGLTYYIRHNNWPENRANFYIAQKVGSLQEEESQRGLAHFLEHMAFNGSDHFKDNNLIELCRQKGIEFGADLNAYTSIDETVYNIDNVPTGSSTTIDSCLLILRDWSTGLTLDPKEIDKERGVIHEEWRLRTSASSRMLERNLPKLYPGSKYGLRFPIGLMSVVDNFTPKELVNYYHKWYHPDHQGLIIVGDIDVDKIEQQIKDLFGNIKNPANEAPLLSEPVPDNATPIVIIDKDKEQPRSIINVMFKHDTTPDSVKGDISYLVADYMKACGLNMLNSRYSEIAQKEGCPFLGAEVGDGAYIYAKTKDAFIIDATPKDSSKVASALEGAFVEVLRAAKFGFTQTEYDRYKQDMKSSLDQQYSNKDKRYNSSFYEAYKAHFLSNEPYMSMEDYYEVMQQIIISIPLEAINETFAQLIPKNDSNLVVVNFNHENENNVYPTAESILNAISSARKTPVTAYVDNVKNEPLIKTLPKAGTIKKETKNDKFGYSKLLLSNGVTVILKKTDFKKNEVLMSGEGDGGSSLYGDADIVNTKLFSSIIGYSGLGNFSSTELQKALSGKVANADLSMGEKKMGLNGSSSPKDVETMLQMAYLYFTDIKKDEESVRKLTNQYEAMLKNRNLSPATAFQDSIGTTIYGYSKRVKPILLDDLKEINYDRILQIAKERTASADGWEFTIIGNYNDSTIRQLVCQYLGALPSNGKNVKAKRLNKFIPGVRTNKFTRKMETPKDNIYILWHNEKIKYTQEKDIQMGIAGDVLAMIYLKAIREDAGAAYSCGAQGGANCFEDGYAPFEIMGSCPVKPEKRDLALKIMNDEIQKLATTCDAEMVDKVKTLLIKKYEDRLKQNGYWMNIIDKYETMGRDDYSNYKQLVLAQTPAKISAMVKEFLNKCDKATIIMIGE